MGKITEDELAMLSDEERAAIADDTDAPSTEEIKAQEEAEAARAAQEAGGGAAQRADKRPDADKSSESKDAENALAALEAKEKADADANVAADAAAAATLTAEEKATAVAKIDEEAAKVAADAKAAQDATDAETARLAADEKKTQETLAPLTSGPPFVLEAEKKHGTKEEIEAKMVELDTKFEDGEIKLSEYNTARAGYVETLTEMKMFGTINAQVQKATAEKAWKDAQIDFFKHNSEYLGERIKNVAYVDAVNRLLATDESKTMTDAEIFEAAKVECDTVFYPAGRKPKGGANVTDIETKRAEVEEKKKAEEAKALDTVRKLEAEKSAGVKTLAKVPVSEANAGVDKYDIIDKLTGDAYEEAVAKMSDAERKIYAARG